MNFPENLTNDEKQEFTCVNMLAHNVAREHNEEIQPCWLCMSEEAKQSAREQAVEWFNCNTGPFIPFSVSTESELRRFENHIKLAMMPMMQRWINAESEMKRIREEENNPRAFFCPNGE